MSTRGGEVDSPRVPRRRGHQTAEGPATAEQQHRSHEHKEYLMITEQELARLLAQLGDTADQVAETLGQAEALGTPEQSANCPVACWLRGKGYEVLIAPDRVILNDGNPDLTWVPLPEPVQQFIEAFDGRHDYQWLDKAMTGLVDELLRQAALAGAVS